MTIAALLLITGASASALETFVGPEIGLPPSLSAAKLGQPDGARGVPALAGADIDGLAGSSCQADNSYERLFAIRCSLQAEGVDKRLSKTWGKPVVERGIAGVKRHWYADGMRVELTGSGDHWGLAFLQHIETADLFHGPAGIPVADLGPASPGMTQAELEAAVPRFTDGHYYDLVGYQDVRFWYRILEGEKIVKELTVTFGTFDPTEGIEAAWGAPSTDGKERPFWVAAERNIRATLVTQQGKTSLQFTPESKGDYSQW